MVIMNKIQEEDIKEFADSFELSDSLAYSNILVTGATGLIGSTLVHCLLALNRGIEITCPVRNLIKAKGMYGEEYKRIHFIECNLTEYLHNLRDKATFQYIVHCASPTSGKYMSEYPVDTYMLAIESTRAILEISKESKASVVYVSSLEYYGQNFDDKQIYEEMQGYVDNNDPRSSYPLGKRSAEFLCSAYSHQYGVNVKVARLTQTFGAGVSLEDNRVFAQFARSVINSEDIILHSKGESAKPYCYTTDCVSAILYILLKGEKGEAYNVANSNTYISIREMAEFVRDNFNSKINILIDEHPEFGYAPTTRLNLSTEKLESLGWHANYCLKKMYENLIKSMRL